MHARQHLSSDPAKLASTSYKSLHQTSTSVAEPTQLLATNPALGDSGPSMHGSPQKFSSHILQIPKTWHAS